MLPIPGTSSVAHLEANLASAAVELTDDQFEELSKIGQRYAEER
jgi:aryl-alcohol dehydrogenase-like predicted oxidoreductase